MYIFIVDNFVYVKNNCNTPEVMHFLVAFLVAEDAVFIILGSFRHQVMISRRHVHQTMIGMSLSLSVQN